MSDHRSTPGSTLRRSLAGGLLILLPVVIVGILFRWIYELASGLISPFTGPFIRAFGLPQLFADIIVVALLVLLCLLTGFFVATRVGSWFWQRTEELLMARIPGYRSVREITVQLLGTTSDSPFKRGEVALVKLFGRDAGVTSLALVTSRLDDGRLSVFVPTGPNPTTGFIYQVDPDLVELRPDIRVEQMMKVIIACGAGTAALLRHPQVAPGAGEDAAVAEAAAGEKRDTPSA